AAQVVRARCWAGFTEPALVDFMGFISVDEDITVLVVGTRFDNTNLLMPAVLATDIVGLHRKSKVLMHSTVFPENSLGVRVITLKRFDSVNVPHHPLAGFDLFQIHQCSGPAFAAGIFL